MGVWIALVLCAFSAGYLLVATILVWRFRARIDAFVPRRSPPPVTLLKPLCGWDPELAENLHACCRQDYPEFQIVFGVTDPSDSAADVARQVIAAHPGLDLELVAGGAASGRNLKVANLANMAPRIHHGIVVIADSDMRVRSDYLQRVTAPFEDPEVGAVTCLYAGSALDRLPPRLGAMFVNDWFLPSALVSLRLGEPKYCFGATMAVRAEILESIGGFAALADFLADDYMLGQAVRSKGYRIALVDDVVENVMAEETLADVVRHEIRWGRTIRAVQPLGYAAAVITDALLVGALASALVYEATQSVAAALLPLAVTTVLRILLHRSVARCFGVRQGPTEWLIPLRDLLTAGVRLWSFFPGYVHWRGHDFGVNTEGKLVETRPTGSPLEAKSR